MRGVLGAFAAFTVLLLFGAMGASVTAPTRTAGAAQPPSTVAGVPADYLAICEQKGTQYEVDWAVLCAIAKIESGFGHNNGPSSAGALGPCQFMPATWATVGHGSINDPADCIDAMARYLKAGGAPADYNAALFSYNHSAAYVAKVMAQADVYRGALEQLPVPLDGSVRARIVAAAQATLTSRTGYLRYSQPGALTDNPLPPPPARTDCSQWVRAIYLAVGLPDPGTTTWDQLAHGHQVVDPQPGDLMFTANEDHVEIYVGDGRTIGHGSPPIDGANVADFPHHFFMTYAGVGG